MRARIVYTVGIDEIPSEVNRLKEKVVRILSESLSAVKDTNIDQSIEKTLTTLKEVGDNLVTVDLLVRDSHAILEGYLASKLDLDTRPANREHQPDQAQDGG